MATQYRLLRKASELCTGQTQREANKLGARDRLTQTIDDRFRVLEFSIKRGRADSRRSDVARESVFDNLEERCAALRLALSMDQEIAAQADASNR